MVLMAYAQYYHDIVHMPLLPLYLNMAYLRHHIILVLITFPSNEGPGESIANAKTCQSIRWLHTRYMHADMTQTKLQLDT